MEAEESLFATIPSDIIDFTMREALPMGSMTIRDIPDDVMRRLEERATTFGRSREAEVRTILADSVAPARDWSAFEAAADMLRKRFAGRVFNNSVDDLADIRAERYGVPPQESE